MNSTIMAGTLLYFAYGSNLLESRLHIANPNATFFDIARLEDYRIDFVGNSKVWSGSVGTIVELPGCHVWGVIWELPASEISNLDRQEGVHTGKYKAFNVSVTTPEGETFECRTYKQSLDPEEIVELDQLPDNRLPSMAYIKVIIKGAKQKKLPEEYIKFLESIKFNPEGTHTPKGLNVCDL
ncbi:GSCOCG00004741001-RA-CDS [Cotesia congregata]|nr:GSCOCG00004741001-RA-CDS [Cotesia congregata]